MHSIGVQDIEAGVFICTTTNDGIECTLETGVDGRHALTTTKAFLETVLILRQAFLAEMTSKRGVLLYPHNPW